MGIGQFSGDRAKYVYTADNGAKYLMTLDVTLAEVEGTGLELNTAESKAIPKPTGFKPRVVFWQGILDGQVKRKELICGTTTGSLYNSNSIQAVTIDGVTGGTTGRRGEKLSF